MATSVAEFSKYVRPEVVGCAEPLIEDAVRRGIREFCKDTWILRSDLAPIPLVDGQAEYALTAPTGRDIFSISHVQYYNATSEQTRVVYPTSVDVLDSQYAYRTWRLDKGTPLQYMLNNTLTTMTLYPIPSPVVSGDTVTPIAVVLPSFTTDTVDDILFTVYGRGIAAYAKAMLMGMAGVAWFNPQMLSVYDNMYRASVADAKISLNRGSMRNQVASALRTTRTATRAGGAINAWR